jgi:5-methylthioadenosine/S-adenosylhomocysteine deaminase
VVWPSDEELALLKKLGVGIVHNPQSNMKLASGVAPVPAMLKDDLPVGLGTDGAASNNDLNLWEEMDTRRQAAQVISKDPKSFRLRKHSRWPRFAGARALHLEKEIGSIEKGKRADIAIVDLDDLNQTPFYNIYSIWFIQRRPVTCAPSSSKGASSCAIAAC